MKWGDLIYSGFAYIYDRLMSDMDYPGWADYIESIFKRNRIAPSLVLDLGCGTGTFCIEMAQRGYEMIGVDSSAEMLSCANAKSKRKECDILFLEQDMTEFELYGTVDAVVSLVDSVNYVTRKRDLKRMFKLTANYLNPGGLFIFDINSRYKLEKTLGSNVFYSVAEDIAYLWQNNFDRKSGICEFDLTFFIKEGECYKRFDELHYERAYSVGELQEMLGQAGLETVGIYEELTFSPPKPRTERIFFVCKKT